jgi:hypothetical protein
MKRVSLMDIKTTQKWVLPAGIVVLGIAWMAAGQTGKSTSKSSDTQVMTSGSQAQATESPAPTVTPNVTVNGQKVPTGTNGSTDVAVPGGKAHVEVSNGHTKITTSSGGASGDTSNQQSGNVDINIDSRSGSGRSWSSTQVNGYSNNSDNSATSINSTSTFSSSSSHTGN